MPHLTIASNPGRRHKKRSHRKGKRKVAVVSYRGKRVGFLALFRKIGRKAKSFWRSHRKTHKLCGPKR